MSFIAMVGQHLKVEANVREIDDRGTHGGNAAGGLLAGGAVALLEGGPVTG